jgi:NurA-like 5'-3' nuclease
MLHDIYLDAIKNREDKIAGISINEDILEKAHELWEDYEPRMDSCELVGVDSSFNKHQFQGFHLYAIDAVCVRSNGNLVSKRYESKIRLIDQRQLEAKSMRMEAEVAREAADKAELVLIDGSMLARFVLGHSLTIKSVVDLTNEHSNIVFVSKTSDTREIFDPMRSKVGDIYYFNRISSKAGYSKPHYVERYEEKYEKGVSIVFARLSDYTPIIKLELLGKVGKTDVEKIIDRISFESVSGYPYVLKVAHNTALITDDDIERLVSIYGLKNEIGAREVLR